MNRIKTLITAIVLMFCLTSFVYATEIPGEDKMPFLPAYTEDQKDEVVEDIQPDNSTSNSTNTGNSGSTSGSGTSSYIPSTKKDNQTDTQQDVIQTENNTKAFADIKQDDWFYDDVIFVFKNNIITGTGKNEFSPYTYLNRAMMVTILHRIDKDNSVYEKNIFNDVEKNSWYENAVNWGYENKIITGTSKNTFAPMDNLTREQLCVMLYNYTKHIGLKTEFADISSYFDNNEVSDWAKDAVCWAVNEKILTGKGENLLSAKDSATRAEAATVIRRYIRKFTEIEEI